MGFIITKVLQIIYSFRTYSFVPPSNRKFSQDFSSYEDKNWAHLRAKAFGDIQSHLPSPVDYEQIRKLIEDYKKVENGKLKVLDFGGGNLVLYHQVSKDFPDLRFEWTIVENSTYFAEIKRNWGEVQSSFKLLNEGFQVGKYPELLITDRIPSQNFDICIAGAVLGWVDSPIDTIAMLSKKADNLLITRTLMAPKKAKIGYQRTYIGEKVLKVKCWFLNENEIALFPEFSVSRIWNSAPEAIYTIYGKWQFKSLLLKRIN